MDSREKLKIRKRLKDSFRFNHFPRPTYCNYCGKEGKIEAHHFRYKPEDYVWVCHKCHYRIDENMKFPNQKGKKHKEETKKKISESIRKWHRARMI